MKEIGVLSHRLGGVFMLRRVAKISMCFQGLPNIAGSSTQHERNMQWDKLFGVTRSPPSLSVISIRNSTQRLRSEHHTERAGATSALSMIRAAILAGVTRRKAVLEQPYETADRFDNGQRPVVGPPVALGAAGEVGRH
jgi:hypothetical protein